MSLRRVKMLMVLAVVAVCITGCPPPVGVVSVTPLAATLQVSQSLPLSASSTNAADAPFTWTNSNPAVATIDATTGLSVTVKAVAPGVTTITVTGSKSGGVATATISVPTTIAEPEPTRVTVTPSSAVLETGKVLALAAVSTNGGDTFSWTQTNAAVAGLSATTGGTIGVTALAPGVTIVTATGSVSGATAAATISVLTPGGQIGTTPLVPEGLKVSVSKVVIPGDLRAEVTFTATNTRGDAIPMVEITESRWIIARLDEAPAAGNSAQYISYISRNVAATADAGVTAPQAAYDSAGLAGLTDNGDGTFTYKFKTALPAGYSVTASHVVGAQMNRTSALDGMVYSTNAIYEWRPDGNPVTVTRALTTTDTCNNCHTRMGFHGGERREVRLCILCHNPGTIDPDTGNTVDMKVFIHKIHRGENLPSVLAGTPYQIIGFNKSINDYSTVAFPQDIRNCAVCHVTGAKAANTQANFLTKPTQAACGSCHDRIWFGDPTATPAGFENHPLDFAQADDSMCATCHTATAPGVAPIAEAHLTVYKNPNARGLDVTITGINANPADGTVALHLLAKNGDGTPITDLSTVTQLGTVVAWPASEYANMKSETIKSATAASAGTLDTTASPTGEYVYTLKNKLPLDAGLTFGIQLTGRLSLTLNGESVTQGIKSNSAMYFTVDGSEPEPRRQVVDDAECAACHGGTIRAHGEQRVGVDGCVMCHFPTNNDSARRPADKFPPVTINFKDMLHTIHTGEELSRRHSIFGFGGSELVANDVRFPGLRQQCSICHGSHNVTPPLAPEAMPTVITNADNTTTAILPERAACTSCHDSLIDDIHAVANTSAAQGVETCAVCHGAGKPEAVATVHKLTP